MAFCRWTNGSQTFMKQKIIIAAMNRMKVLTIFCVTLITASNMYGQTPAPTLTLRQCVEAALQNNPDVKAAAFNADRSWITLRGAKGSMLPDLNGEINHNRRWGRSIDPNNNSYITEGNTTAYYGITSNVTVFRGFSLFNALKSSQYLNEAGKLQLQQQKDLITLRVILAYLDVLNNSDVLTQTEQQAKTTQQQVTRLEILHKEGAIKPSDLFDLKGELAGQQLNITNARNDLNDARLTLAQLMNVPFDESLQVERLSADQFEMGYQAKPDSIYQVALEQLAQIKGVELIKKGREKSVQSARGALFPSIGLGAGLTSDFSAATRDRTTNDKVGYFKQLDNNHSPYIGVGVNIPLMNGFQSRNRLSQAQIDLKEAEFLETTQRTQLKQNIERDYLDMNATLSRYQALVEQVAAYKENFRAAEVRFNNGASTSVDYLIAKNKLDNANISLIIARYGYVLRTRILDYYQGKLLW